MVDLTKVGNKEVGQRPGSVMVDGRGGPFKAVLKRMKVNIKY